MTRSTPTDPTGFAQPTEPGTSAAENVRFWTVGQTGLLVLTVVLAWTVVLGPILL